MQDRDQPGLQQSVGPHAAEISAPVATPRLIFANQLRGLAALCVVVSHWVVVFWGMRPYVAFLTSTPVLTNPSPPLFHLLDTPWFNFGPFGVGVFFLISGLVIPISLHNHTRRGFLIARAWRIYPTYWAALAIEIAALHGASAYWHRPFAYSGPQIAANLLLIHTTIGRPAIDMVNWTLCIELKFYLLAALVGPAIRAGKTTTLFVIAAGILAAHLVGTALFGIPAPPGFWAALSSESMFLIVLLAGVLFSFHHARQLSTQGLVAGVAAMMVMFSLSWPASSLADQFPRVWLNYVYALGLFSVAYAARSWVRANAVLDFFAAISFPLYLVHSVMGLLLLKLLILHGISYLPALGVTLAAVVGMASGLHYAIEKPTAATGKKQIKTLLFREKEAKSF